MTDPHEALDAIRGRQETAHRFPTSTSLHAASVADAHRMLSTLDAMLELADGLGEAASRHRTAGTERRDGNAEAYELAARIIRDEITEQLGARDE